MSLDELARDTNAQDTRCRVFCLGLSRTATTSLCAALEVLGYSALHFSMDLFVSPEIIAPELKFVPQLQLSPYWSWERENTLRALNERFDRLLFEKHNALGDSPIPLFYRQLDKKFPNSKFIYTFRDEEKWLKSMRWLIEEGSVLWRHGLLEDEMKYQIYKCVKFEPSTLLKVYRKYHEEVLAYFADRSHDILILNLDERPVSFEPICNFLNLPVPSTPFPVINEKRSVSRIAKMEYKLARKLPVYNFVKKRIAQFLPG